MMKVLVDTSIWSLALRHNATSFHIEKLTRLIMESMVVIIGPIRQELLSGISNKSDFDNLRLKLQNYTDILISTNDYETAAEYFNICRQHGVQGSHIDFLICAVAANNDLYIYSADQDFIHFARHLPIRLYEPIN